MSTQRIVVNLSDQPLWQRMKNVLYHAMNVDHYSEEVQRWRSAVSCTKLIEKQKQLSLIQFEKWREEGMVLRERIRKLQNALLHLLGIDHEKLTFKRWSFEQKPTDINPDQGRERFSDSTRPTRRSFLKQSSMMAGAAAIPPFQIQASDKSGSRLPIVGSGAHTYECVHDWLEPPQGLLWGDTHGLCQDQQGQIYVAHTVHKSSVRGEAIVVYDAKGHFVRAFGKEFRDGAHGLNVRSEAGVELLYHCDINRCMVVKTTLDGEVVWTHGYPREDPAYTERPIDFMPTNVAFAPNDDFYVGDGYGSSHMLRFSKTGNFLGEIGRPGKADGEFSNPHGQGSIHAGSNRCWLLPIVVTDVFRLLRSMGSTCVPSRMKRTSGCRVIFIHKVNGWCVQISIVRCAFLIAITMWLRSLVTVRRSTGKSDRDAASPGPNLRPVNLLHLTPRSSSRTRISSSLSSYPSDASRSYVVSKATLWAVKVRSRSMSSAPNKI